VQDLFHKNMRSLSPTEALDALRVSLRQSQSAGTGRDGGTLASPIVPGSLYEGLASPALVEHALDQQGALGVLGWPTEEVLHGYRFKQIQPARHLLIAVLNAIDADESLDVIEHHMGNEPLLNYRFLRYANSAGLGLQRETDSVRKGLMVMGYSKLRAWLMEQLPHASSDPNLDPIRAKMVLRARIMERLADAGIEDDLRREVFLCGLFSQMDYLVGEPLAATLLRLPLPGRVSSAILGQTGPYAPWLDVATVLESGSPKLIRDVCKAHRIPAEEVNRALLRALAAD
jgi:c-di-GMP-related signal transduction protein